MQPVLFPNSFNACLVSHLTACFYVLTWVQEVCILCGTITLEKLFHLSSSPEEKRSKGYIVPHSSGKEDVERVGGILWTVQATREFSLSQMQLPGLDVESL